MAKPADKNIHIDPDGKALMRSIIGRIATGPDLSKDISEAEARAGMAAVLNGEIDPVQMGIFLIALRMKRETDDENAGIMLALRDATSAAEVDVDELVDISEPYNGFNRCLPASPFLALVLGACGVPAFSHGLETVGPKNGITHKQILRDAGLPVDLTPEQAARRLEDPSIGWAYVDQSQFNPKACDMIDFRNMMIKRSVITTVEMFQGALRARKNHLMSGYVHKPYSRIYNDLARKAGYDSCLLIRGIEGGVIPSLRQPGKFFYYKDGSEDQNIDVHPNDLGIDHPFRAIPVPDEWVETGPNGDKVTGSIDNPGASKAAAEAGIAALKGEKGATYDSLVYSAAVCLWHLGRHESIDAATAAVRAVLDSGKAAEHLK